MAERQASKTAIALPSYEPRIKSWMRIPRSWMIRWPLAW